MTITLVQVDTPSRYFRETPLLYMASLERIVAGDWGHPSHLQLSARATCLTFKV